MQRSISAMARCISLRISPIIPLKKQCFRITQVAKDLLAHFADISDGTAQRHSPLAGTEAYEDEDNHVAPRHKRTPNPRKVSGVLE